MDGTSDLRWGVSRRMEFLEARLFWEGKVNRSDLVQAFRVSTAQASADLSRYQLLAPGNVEYDRSAKTYISAATFTPVYGIPSSETYLATMRQSLEEEDGSDGPFAAAVPKLKRKVNAETLRSIVKAIRERKSIQIQYQSATTEGLSWRWIGPHALGFDGLRWHARAFCYRRREFRDFVLSRMFAVDGERTAEVPADCDVAWARTVTLRLKPNPELSDGMKRAVEREYEMEDGEIKISTRVCLVFYIIVHLGLESSEASKDPARFQVVVANKTEVDSAIEQAKGDAVETLERHTSKDALRA